MIGPKNLLPLSMLFVFSICGVSYGLHYWDDEGADHNWCTPANWTGNTLPNGDAVILTSVTPGAGPVLDGCNDSTNILIVGSTGYGELTIQSGTLQVNSSFRIGQNAGRTGIVTINGGTINQPNSTSNDLFLVGDFGHGELNMNGGSLNVWDFRFPYNSSGSGVVNMTGGTMTVRSTLRVGHGAPGRLYLDGGMVKSNNFTITANGYMNITSGTLVCTDGNRVSRINDYAASGILTAWGGLGIIQPVYDSGENTTTVTALGSVTKAWNPQPANGASGLDAPVDLCLTWNRPCYGEFTAPTVFTPKPVSYNVYFGPSGNMQFRGNQTDTTFDPPGELIEGVTYQWRIDVYDESGPTPVLLSTGDTWSFTAGPSMLNYYFAFSEKEKIRLAQAKAAGLIEIAPVALPVAENVVADNDHFGWPVAAMVGDTIVVHFKRSLSHSTPDPVWGDTKNDWSIDAIIRSTDGGQTWGPIIGVNQLAAAGTGKKSGGAMLSIGRVGNSIVMPNRYIGGVLISNDAGQTWTHYPSAFSGLTTSRTNMGPTIIDHPLFGAMMFNGQHTSPDTAFLWSTNNGLNWSDAYWSDPGTSPVEPEALTWDNNILLISREFNTDFGRVDGRYYMQSQHLYKYKPGDTVYDVNFETRRTNMRGNKNIIGAGSRWSHDTSGLLMNPVTGRIECLDSHRHGGGLGDTDVYGKSTLNLWTIDPDELLAGGSRWRFDGVLLERARETDHGDDYCDGMHPGAPVTDVARGKQHIFVFAGYTDQAAGIFRVSRTLDTVRLRRWLLNYYATIWNFEPANGIIYDDSGYALHGTVVGSPTVVAGSAAYGSTGALRFGTGSDRVEYADPGNTFFDFKGGDVFTVETLIRTSGHGSGGFSGAGAIVDKKDATRGWSLRVENGKVGFLVDEGAVESSVYGSTIVSDGQWHHVAAVRDRGRLLVYVDHVLDGIGQDATTASLDNNASLRIGSMSSATREFVGDIDYFKLSREVLNPVMFLQRVSARGDANYDGKIDDADLAIIQANLGKTDTDLGAGAGDFDFNGVVDEQDMTAWTANEGRGTQMLPVTEGLLLYLDAADAIVDGGGKVVYWPDRAAFGGANNAVLGGSDPSLTTITFANGVERQAVDFDGNDYLLIAADDDFDSRYFTWFIVFDPGLTSSTETLLRSSYDDRGDGIANTSVWGTYLEGGSYKSHTRTSSGSMKSASGGPITTDWAVVCGTWDGANGISQFVNGGSAGSSTETTAEPFYHQGTSIGALIDGPSGFDGRISKILVYNRVLNANERQAVEAELSLNHCGSGPAYQLDINKNCVIEFLDFAVFAENWLSDDCFGPSWCSGADVNNDRQVDTLDLEHFAEAWLWAGE
jgi:hypothetical protein